MSGRRRLLVPALLVAAVVLGSIFLTSGSRLGSQVADSPSPVATPLGPEATLNPAPTPRPPLGGTELYGYLPYWQMTSAVADYLHTTPVTTLEMFSVTATRSGPIFQKPQGYRHITGDIGRRIIREAHDRGARVELVFSSFGADRNGRLFGRLDPAAPTAPPPAPPPSADASPGPSGVVPPAATATPVPTTYIPTGPPPWKRTVPSLVALALNLGVDGVNVDVELLDPQDREQYGEFLAALRTALRKSIRDGQVSVATEAGERGIGNAATAAAAGVDRVFLMGYDYHWSGSTPGAVSPVDRLDGIPTLRWSIGRYVEAGVPRDRIVLGLPLYGTTWRTLTPDRTGLVVGNGIPWLPRDHLDTLQDPTFAPIRDPFEMSEWFATQDGEDWLLTYYDSPATLRPKLALARDEGLAGGGFWALGYDRGVPGYEQLMADFVKGKISRDESPAAP
jgi:hypothetical protein